MVSIIYARVIVVQTAKKFMYVMPEQAIDTWLLYSGYKKSAEKSSCIQ